MTKPVSTQQDILIGAPCSHAFAVAIHLQGADFIHARGPIPGIRETLGPPRPWSKVGDMRRHVLDDGTSIDELLTKITKNEGFTYEVRGFSGLFGYIVHSARGEWRFQPAGANETKVTWRYSFSPTGYIARPVLALLVILLWPGYLVAALQRYKDVAEISQGH